MSIVQDNVNAEMDRIDRIHNWCFGVTMSAMAVIVVVSMFLLCAGCASTKETGKLRLWPAPGWEVQDAED